MLGYVMVGTGDMERSTGFYDVVFSPLGLARNVNEDTYAGYCPESAPEEPVFYVTIPYNEEPATVGNGTMIALLAETRQAVDEFHKLALANGGTDEGKPAPAPRMEAFTTPTPATRMATRSAFTAPGKRKLG